MSWIGRKKIAFVPLSRPNAHPPDFIPTIWENDIRRRVWYDPDPATGWSCFNFHLPGTRRSAVASLNEAGQAAGASTIGGDAANHPFLWDVYRTEHLNHEHGVLGS